jgi:hypothetical protein
MMRESVLGTIAIIPLDVTMKRLFAGIRMPALMTIVMKKKKDVSFHLCNAMMVIVVLWILVIHLSVVFHPLLIAMITMLVQKITVEAMVA